MAWVAQQIREAFPWGTVPGVVRAKRLAPPGEVPQRLGMQNPFRYFNRSPEIIRLAVMMYVRFPLSLLQVEDLPSGRGIDICHETVQFWWNRFGPLFAAELRKGRVHRHWYSNWRWYLDEVFVRINGKTCYLWHRR